MLLHVLTQKGKGFEPAMQKQKKFHGLGPYDPETGETKPLGRRTYSEVFADTMVKLADFDPTRWWPSPPPCPTAPASTASSRIIRTSISTWGSPRSMRSCSPPGWPPRVSNRSAPSTPRSCSAPSTPSCTMSACKTCRWSSAWTAEVSPPTTVPRITVSSTSVICAAFRTWCTWCRKTKTSWPTCCSPPCSGSGPIAVRYPRGLGPGTPVKDVPRAIPIGKAELLQHSDHDRVAIFALGALVPMAEEIARKLEGRRHRRGGDQCPLRQADRRRDAGVLRRLRST